ncbi:CinA family protein [Propionibacterium australiense]|uniref:Competence-damaged protein n=1 Tax=Propionibacterium australiense TaxID=119981 RepID=A0A383S631_9ACTN|nr:CinA family protein [Propionibacterium australiense]RLP10626.1 nicotinamide-nucleotide amidohydrolase family protein [Propionibacterium australiense]SYZ32829.1 Competence-damaged protein [Propionibacterium australiense]VEH91161.1 competence damage-inducible protein A [Propionibacterium australiense]
MSDLDEPTRAAAEQLLELCRRRGLGLATCESITGGGIGWALTSVPGASDVFRGGLITYASELKTLLAGVDAGFIAGHGVINERTALEMACGAARACGADVAISATGTAGPSGQDGTAPGTVWIGIRTPAGTRAHRLVLGGGRARIRRAAVRRALQLAAGALA